MEVDFGARHPVKHKFIVLDSREQTFILGRDFLKRFRSTEFDWENHVRLGEYWLSTEALLWLAACRSYSMCVGRTRFFPPTVDWNINPGLNQQEKGTLRTLWEEYLEVFGINPKKPSKTSITEHTIETGGPHPVRAKYGRVPPQAAQEINNQIHQILGNGIIRPSSSPWASRVIIVQKKDGTTRFAIDYRELNDLTKKDSYPIPEMKDILDKLHGSEFFSTLDGASAYWSIPIAEEDIEKTAFVSPRGEFEFSVMPFVLCNAPSTYERVIDSVLKNAPHSLPYIDKL